MGSYVAFSSKAGSMVLPLFVLALLSFSSSRVFERVLADPHARTLLTCTCVRYSRGRPRLFRFHRLVGSLLQTSRVIERSCRGAHDASSSAGIFALPPWGRCHKRGVKEQVMYGHILWGRGGGVDTLDSVPSITHQTGFLWFRRAYCTTSSRRNNRRTPLNYFILVNFFTAALWPWSRRAPFLPPPRASQRRSRWPSRPWCRHHRR